MKLAQGSNGRGSYCAACFDGNYPTEIPENGKDRFEQKIPKEWLDRHTKQE